MNTCSTCLHGYCNDEKRDDEPAVWQCTHSECVHPVTGMPLPCAIARTPMDSPLNTFNLLYCGPAGRFYEPAKEPAC